MNKGYGLIDKIIEMEIYLYFVFMFITKGEAIRNILLFSAFILWLSTIKYRQAGWLLKEPVPLLFWGFIGTILLSVIFSIDPIYSLNSFKEEPLKSVLIFILVSTTLTDEKRLKRFLFVSFFIFLFTVAISYYSFLFKDVPLMQPDTSFRHANPNRLALDLNTLMVFLFVFFLIVRKTKFKNTLLISFIPGIVALILTGSRGGNISFVAIVCIWLLYLSGKKIFASKKLLSIMILIIILSGILGYLIIPEVKYKITKLPSHISSFHGRFEEIWVPLIYAVKERPVLGWGHGAKIFSMDTPFENTPFMTAPVHVHDSHRNPHNAFLAVLFHQGITGLILYALLLTAAIKSTYKAAYRTDGLQSYMLIACSSILIGLFVLNSIVENVHFDNLSFILGIGIAAKYMKKDATYSTLTINCN